MKILAVYLTEASPDQPFAVFPGPRTEAVEERIADFIARASPGRPFDLREEDVEAFDKSKLQ